MRGYPVSLISIALAFAAKNFGIQTTLKRALCIVENILNLLNPPPPVFTVEEPLCLVLSSQIFWCEAEPKIICHTGWLR